MSLNSIERTWVSGPTAARMVAERQEQFDFLSGLFHSPLAWDWQAVTPAAAVAPSMEWIATELSAFVRDEFGSRVSERAMPKKVTRPRRKCSLRQAATERLAWAERTQVYSHSAQKKLANLIKDEKEPRWRLHEILSSPPFGARENRKNVTKETFESTLLAGVDLRVGARLILMGLPFRDQNPFRTIDEPSSLTMNEAAFLIQLHTMSLAIYQIFPSGSTATIIADGRFYAPTLGVEVDDANLYLTRLRQLRNDLNLQGTVTILDLQDIVNRFSESGKQPNLFQETVLSITSQLRDAVEAGDDTCSRSIASIKAGMRWNCNIRPFAVKIAAEELWAWLHGQDVNSNTSELDEYIEYSSYTYAAQNLALRFYRVVPTMLPGYIRASVHPKPGQVGVARLGPVSPWNGIAYMPNGVASLTAVPLYALPDTNVTAYYSDEYGVESIAYYA